MLSILCKVKWDDEGYGLKECRLPEQVLILNVPICGELAIGKFSLEIEDEIGDLLSNSFGFCHDGWTWENFCPTHAGGGYLLPPNTGVILYQA